MKSESGARGLFGYFFATASKRCATVSQLSRNFRRFGSFLSA